MDSIKAEIKSRCGRTPKELKFNSAEDDIRKSFLNLLVEAGGKFGYVYVNKKSIYTHLRTHPEINFTYNQLVYYLLENLIKNERIKEHITVYIDQRSNQRDIKKDLAAYIKSNIDRLLEPKQIYLRFERSHNSRGIQCADFVCGSAYDFRHEKRPDYYDIIKNEFVVKKDLILKKTVKSGLFPPVIYAPSVTYLSGSLILYNVPRIYFLCLNGS